MTIKTTRQYDQRAHEQETQATSWAVQHGQPPLRERYVAGPEDTARRAPPGRKQWATYDDAALFPATIAYKATED